MHLIPIRRPKVRALKIFLAAALASTASIASADMPTNWDGLVSVKAKKLEYVYLLPNANFSQYTKVMIDPPTIATKPGWVSNYNANAENLENRLSDVQVHDAITKASAQVATYFTNAFTAGGYQVVNAPGPGVLHISIDILNVVVTAPDTMSSVGMSGVNSAGQATLVVSASDSLTNQLLGRGVDQQVVGNTVVAQIASQATNWGAFDDQFKTWAKETVNGVNELKSLSPVDVNGMRRN
jgi:hypothetical protein